MIRPYSISSNMPSRFPCRNRSGSADWEAPGASAPRLGTSLHPDALASLKAPRCPPSSFSESAQKQREDACVGDCKGNSSQRRRYAILSLNRTLEVPGHDNTPCHITTRPRVSHQTILNSVLCSHKGAAD